MFTRAKVIVLLDGCFWHGCPEHYTVSKTNPEFWANKRRENRLRDEDTDRLFGGAGWLVIRVWEHEDSAHAAQRIAEVVRRRRSQR